MEKYILALNSQQATLEAVGGKGAALAQMARAGLPVPKGFHVTTGAYRDFVAANQLAAVIRAALAPVDLDQPSTLETASAEIRRAFEAAPIPPAVASAIAQGYAGLAGTEPVVAVRSSATAEDLPDLSFAGQQETFLNVAGIAAVLDAVQGCWASLWTGRAIGYRARHAIDPEDLALAVVVQRLIPAEVAGILFTANPVNGRWDQALVNAAWGLGEAVVGGEVTPDTFVVDSTTGAVVERQIAEKAVMTVRVNGGTATQPVPVDLRRAPSLSDEQVAALVRIGEQIEALYGAPRDIEWALADGAFAIVQARPITALPAPEAAPPDDWPLPDPKGQYIRTSIIDFMPNPLSPLFETWGLAYLNKGMQDLVERLGTSRAAMPDNLMVTINDYAYMNTTFSLKQWLALLFVMGPRLPKALRQGEARWREKAMPRYQDVVSTWQAPSLASMTPDEILEGVSEILDAMTYYLTTLQSGVMGNSAFSEAVFTGVYDKLIKRDGDPDAPTFLLGFESMPIRAETELYDLGQWCREREDLATYIQGTSVDRLVQHLTRSYDSAPPDGVAPDALETLRRRIQDHLHTYGHVIYSLDFAESLPADDPEPVVRTLKLYVQGQGSNPHTRRRKLVERREAATEAVLSRVKGLKRRWFTRSLRKAQSFAPLREDAIAGIGLGYPRLRAMLRELGRRLVEAGAIAAAEDVFWLTREELEQCASALGAGGQIVDHTGTVAERKMIWRGEKRATPPPQLPAKGKVMGLNADVFIAADASEQTGAMLKGVAASPGRVTATARVLHGPEDFDQLAPGDVLVAGITTPAWTPLFAIAAGIVTDVGGPLSHGSIVAREYGIPAVLGTGVATRRIQSGQTVTVDGDAGKVTLERGDGDGEHA